MKPRSSATAAGFAKEMACSSGAGAAKSGFEAKRLIQQCGVEVDRKPLVDIDNELSEREYIIRVGRKRFIRTVSKG